MKSGLLTLWLGFCHDHALILYVYLPNDDDNAEESVLTVNIPIQYHRALNDFTDLCESIISAHTAHSYEMPDYTF